jgi:hypothetical protein
MISLVHSPLSRGLRVLEPFAFACSEGLKPGHFNFKSLVIYLSAAYVICRVCAMGAGWLEAVGKSARRPAESENGH